MGYLEESNGVLIWYLDQSEYIKIRKTQRDIIKWELYAERKQKCEKELIQAEITKDSSNLHTT